MRSGTGIQQRSGPAALQFTLLIQLVLVLACLGTEAFRLVALHMRGNYVMPILVGPGDLFPDFLIWVSVQFDHYHTAAFFQPGSRHFLYPPGAGLVYAFFHLFGEGLLPLYIANMTAIFVTATCLFSRALVRRGEQPRRAAGQSCLLLACAYPVWFAFQRGNIEFDVWMICALGAWALFRKRGYTAAACFGLAASMKFYPGVYVGLLIAKKRWREVAWGVAIFGSVSLVSLWLMYPHVTESLRQTRIGLQTFASLYVEHVNLTELGWDHSLFGLYKRSGLGASNLAVAAHRYTLGAAIAGLMLWLLRIRHLPIANQIIALTAAMVMLPPVSFDYTLLHLYTAFGFALFATWDARVSRGALAVFACLAFTVAPLSEVVSGGVAIEGQLKAVFLCLLFVVAMCFPLPEAGNGAAGSVEWEEDERDEGSSASVVIGDGQDGFGGVRQGVG